MSFTRISTPKASKDYKCRWCGESIPKGESHVYAAGVFEGEFSSSRWHPECNEVWERVGEEFDWYFPHDKMPRGGEEGFPP